MKNPYVLGYLVYYFSISKDVHSPDVIKIQGPT